MPIFGMKRKIEITLWSLFSIFMILSMLWMFLEPHENMRFQEEKVFNLNDDWQYKTGQKVTELTLPTEIPSAGSTLVIERQLPEQFEIAQTICFRSSQARVKVWLGGEMIYSFGWQLGASSYSKTPGSAWNLVTLPEHSGGKQIKIELQAVHHRYNGVINEIRFGTRSGLIFSIIHQNISAVLLSGFIFALGILLILVYFFIERPYSKSRRLLSLGFFAVFIGGWLLGECRILQFFAENMSAMGVLTILCMLLFPIPLVQLIDGIEKYPYHKLTAVCQWLLILVATAAMGMQLPGVADLVENVYLMQMVEIGVGIVLLISLFVDDEKNKNKAVEEFLVPICILIIFGVFEEVSFIRSPQGYTGTFIRIGVLVFILIQGYFSIQKAATIIRRSREAAYYERLAKRDALTHCLNRRAYYEELETLKGPDLFVVAIDVNDLKKINDNYGHDRGDDAIIRCAKLAEQIFGQWGHTYRIGGDEFAFVGSHIAPQALQEKAMEFHLACGIMNETVEYSFHAAVGYALFDESKDKNAADTARRADRAMYEEKTQDKTENEGE